MKRWNVSARVFGSKWIGVFEAETAEDAIAKAEQEAAGRSEREGAQMDDIYEVLHAEEEQQ